MTVAESRRAWLANNLVVAVVGLIIAVALAAG